MKTINVEREIQKENALREIYNAECKRLQPILEPFVGQQIVNKGGDLRKKLKDLLTFEPKKYKIEPLTPGAWGAVDLLYISASFYSLLLNIRINYNGGSFENRTHYCEYKSYDFMIGDIDREPGILKKLTIEEMPPIDAVEQRKQYDKVVGMMQLVEKETDKLWYGIKPGR